MTLPRVRPQQREEVAALRGALSTDSVVMMPDRLDRCGLARCAARGCTVRLAIRYPKSQVLLRRLDAGRALGLCRPPPPGPQHSDWGKDLGAQGPKANADRAGVLAVAAEDHAVAVLEEGAGFAV